jgi:hypothetical protein
MNDSKRISLRRTIPALGAFSCLLCLGLNFVPHLIHDASGVGCSIAAQDLNGDGKVDVFTTNKKGTFLHLQR